MKFTVNRNDIACAVTHSVHGIPNNPVTPIYAGMRIETRTGSVIFSGCDGDVTFDASTLGDTSEDETIIVPGKLFTEVIRTLPDMDVSFTSEDNTAVLTCGRGVFKFPVYKDVYPDLPLEANILGEIDADVFLDAFRKVMPACAKTDSNPALTAVLLEPTGENLLMAATDRYRLATVETTWTPTDPCEPVLLPAWAVERFLRAAEGTVSLGWDDRVVSLASGVLRATGRRMQGEFPQWRALMPTVPCDVTVNTGALMGALKRAQLAAEQDSPVELSFTNGSLKVSAGYGNRAEDVLDTSYNGPGFTALFGVSRLMDGLAGCTDMVGFGFTEPLKPVWLQSGDFNYTVLPRRRI